MTTHALPSWAAALVRQVNERAAADAAHEKAIERWAAAKRKPRDRAVLNLPDLIYTAASAVLATPADHPAHAVDYATGLLNETVDFMNANRRAAPEGGAV